MTTPAKLYGRDLSEYDEIDVDELLNKLSAEEINILAKEVDPDVSNWYLFRATINAYFRTHSCPRHKGVVTTARKNPRAP